MLQKNTPTILTYVYCVIYEFIGPDNFNGVLSKVAARLRDYFAKYDVASRGRRKFAVLGKDCTSVAFICITRAVRLWSAPWPGVCEIFGRN